MKKTYSKPQLFMEEFTLSEHIAGCALNGKDDDNLNTNHGDTNNCQVEIKDDFEDGWLTYFMNSDARCTGGELSGGGLICYQGILPTADKSLFGS